MPDPGKLPDISVIPVFPLAGVTLFPHTHLPLHVFEQRYRALVEDTLRKVESQHCFAMGIPLPTEDSASQERPTLFPFVGVGRIIEFSRLPDGRFMLVLQGLGRASLGQEFEMVNGYRVFEARWQPDLMPKMPGNWASELATELKTLALALLRDQAEKFRLLLTDEDDLSRLTDIISGYLPLPPEFKLEQLANPNVMYRAARAISQLEAMLSLPPKPVRPDLEAPRN
ncbi:MAG: LON peptidase substrate-binding domain-containing protein [Planctomycetes bacterium]|nr:LON peptidase substrate-binding domain-containing protein [Planctomycetota bacterium]